MTHAVNCHMHVIIYKCHKQNIGIAYTYKVQIFQFLDIDTAGSKQKHATYQNMNMTTQHISSQIINTIYTRYTVACNINKDHREIQSNNSWLQLANSWV